MDLRFLTVLTAIATQGAISRETQNGYYVRSYKLEVSTNGEDWMMYRHGKNHKVSASPPFFKQFQISKNYLDSGIEELRSVRHLWYFIQLTSKDEVLFPSHFSFILKNVEVVDKS